MRLLFEGGAYMKKYDMHRPLKLAAVSKVMPAAKVSLLESIPYITCVVCTWFRQQICEIILSFRLSVKLFTLKI